MVTQVFDGDVFMATVARHDFGVAAALNMNGLPLSHGVGWIRILLMHSVQVFGVLAVLCAVCVCSVTRGFLEVDVVGVSKYGHEITGLAKRLASDFHVNPSGKNPCAKTLEVDHKDGVVDGSLVDFVGWWILQFRRTGKQVTPFIPMRWE
jgi:hypothetical protein